MLGENYVGTPEGIRNAPKREAFDNYLKNKLGPLVAIILAQLMRPCDNKLGVGKQELVIITNVYLDF